MAKLAPQKILRIGIIQNDTVLEERLIRKLESITIGTSPKCTFIVPLPPLKRPIPFLQVHKGQFHLAYIPGTRGRLSIQGQVRKLEDAVKMPGTEKRGDVALIPLDENSRGKIRLHDLTILFQFVTPPPTLPKPQLPASARGNFFRQIDYTLLSFLLLSLLIQAGGVGSLEFWWNNYGKYSSSSFSSSKQHLYEDLVSEIEIRPETVQEEPEEEPEEDPEEVAEVAEKQTVKEKPKRRPKPKPAPTRQVSAAERMKARKIRQRKVRNNTILRYIGRDVGNDGDLEGAGLKHGVNSESLSAAWGNTGGVRAAEAGESGGYQDATGVGGAGSYARGEGTDLGGGQLGQKQVRGARRTTQERSIKLRIGGSLGRQSGMGRVDRASVANVFRSRKGAIQYCYRKALARNRATEGKITIRFTIGLRGRVTDIRIKSNQTGDSSLGQCIVGKVKSWPFPKPKERPVDFEYPFILRKG
jgi:TonB family protein